MASSGSNSTGGGHGSHHRPPSPHLEPTIEEKEEPKSPGVPHAAQAAGGHHDRRHSDNAHGTSGHRGEGGHGHRSHHHHGPKMVHPHEVSIADDWSTPNTKEARSGSFSGLIKTQHHHKDGDHMRNTRSTSLGSKSSSVNITFPSLYSSYPTDRKAQPDNPEFHKKVDFLAIQQHDIHEIKTEFPAGHLQPDPLGTTDSENTQREKHPRLLHNIYRDDMSLRYELLVPPKKSTRNFINTLSRLFAKTAGVITHGSRSEAARLTHLPEVFVVPNDHAGSGGRSSARDTPEDQRPLSSRSRSASIHNVTSETISRRDTSASSIGVASSRFRMKMSDSFAIDTPPPTDSSHIISKKRSALDDPSSHTSISFEKDLGSMANQMRRSTLAESASHIRMASVSTGGVGFYLNTHPKPPTRSPTCSQVGVDRPDSPHIPTPTRTGGSLSTDELQASTPDRYQENASALYLMQPVSVNTFRRLRPAEAMSLRYIDRTSSLSLCVSSTDHSADLVEKSGDDFDDSDRSNRSASVMSQSEFGEYGACSLIPTHKRALVYQGGEWLINNPDRTVYTLLYTKHTKVGMKDFAVDFRAQMDTDRLLRDAIVVLDSNDSHIYKIIQRLVGLVVDRDFEETGRGSDAMRKGRAKEEAMKRLFVDKSVTVLSRTIQGGCLSEYMDDTLDIQMACDQIWICAFAQMNELRGRYVSFYRTACPVNMGHISEELKFVCLVLTPTVEKSTKQALETTRTFATLFLDVETRNQLSGAIDEQEFRDILADHASRLHAIQEHPELVRRLTQKRASRVYFKSRCLSWYPGQGIISDIKRRWPHYKSDYTDGLRNTKSVHKLISTTLFLYFAILLPTLAFGVLNDSNTNGSIGVQKHILAQLFGGCMFGIFGGQPLLVIMTTAPLGLYMRILYSIANQFQVDFFAFYSCIGLWNCFFLCLYALMNTSCLTNLCTRTIQDIFEMFALFAFVVDGLTELMHNFGDHYFSEACANKRSGVWVISEKFRKSPGRSATSTATPTTTTALSSTVTENLVGSNLSSPAPFDLVNFLASRFIMKRDAESDLDGSGSLESNETYGDDLATQPYATSPSTMIVQLIESALNSTDVQEITSTILPVSRTGVEQGECRRDRALLYLLLMVATWWTSLRLHGFAKTPYLSRKIREFLADYSLPIAILAVSLAGRLFFGDVQLEVFTIYDYTPVRAEFEKLPLWCVFVCGGIGFVISLLFFFDTTITNSVVCRPSNKLKKGTTYDYDLLIVALINGFLSIFSLPWLYPTTPQSPLHLLGLADVEERVDAGHVYQAVVRVRETRLTMITSSVMIGLSLFMLPYPLAYISRPVLNGLFLYMAAMSIHDNQLMERIILLFTEQTSYPPHHYVRTVPQRSLHLITVIQIFQLVILCGMGLYGHNIYLEMLFPVVLCLMFPVRHTLMPKIIDIKYLESLEGLKAAGLGARRVAPNFNPS